MNIRKENLILLLVFSMLAVLIGLLWIQPKVSSRMDDVVIALSIMYALICVAIYIFSTNNKNFVRIDTLFILGYVIVNFQWPIMVVKIGKFPAHTFFLAAMEQYITYGAWISSFGLVVWLFGASVANIVHKYSVTGRTFKYVGNSFTIKVQVLSAVLFILFVATAGKSYISGSVYTGGSDNALSTTSGLSSYFLTLLSITTTLLIYFHLNTKANIANGGINNRANIVFWNNIFYFFLFLYIAFFTYVGERGEILRVIMTYGIIYGAIISNISVRKTMFMLIPAIIAFAFLGLVRAFGIADSIYMFSDYEFLDMTISLASSVGATYFGLDLLQSSEGYYLGQLWISNILSVIPFAQGILLSYSDYTIYDVNSANAITAHVFGVNPRSGLGTNIVIDTYLNFGVFGVATIMFFFGFICRRLQLVLELGGKPFITIFALVLASMVFYINRSSPLILLQPVLWSVLLVFIMKPSLFKKG